MEVNKLTDLAIQKSKAGDKDYAMSDGAGLYLWVTTAGGKLWRWGYVFDGKNKTMSYGKYPYVGLAKARELHLAARTLLAAGTDPMAERMAKKNENNTASKKSFQTIATLWLSYWRDGKSKRHADTVERRMNADILPAIGARPIDKIETPEIVKMVTDIQDRGALDIAKRALETTGQIFRYAIARGYAKHNPAVEIKPRDVLKSRAVVNFARIERRDLPKLLQDWADFLEETPRTGRVFLPRPKWQIYGPDSMPIPSVQRDRGDERRAGHFAG